MTTLVLIRHGQTASNISGALDTGCPGVPLTALGKQQAQALAGRWLDDIGPAPHIVGISPLRRTRMTAAPLIERFSPRVDVKRGVREIRAGDLEMGTSLSDGFVYHRTVERWCAGEKDLPMPGAENGYDVLARALPDIFDLLYQAQDASGNEGIAALVVHGAFIRFIGSQLAHNLSAELVGAVRMDNTMTTRIEFDANILESAGPGEILGRGTALTWNDQPIDSYSSLNGGHNE
ncbi:MAG: histidine phosphatase family protein [Actinomycetaceae bacterium]|nr:histidine phosphatase family protein [Actinomycetaceae bacterium]